MLIGVTTTGMIVLAVAAGLFVIFALVSSFYFPRRDPDFPGNRLGAFVALTVLLFIVLIGAMVAFGAEGEAEEGGSGEAASTQPAGSVTETGEETETEPEGETGTEGETETEGGGESGGEGDAAAGEEVFAANGCASCHTLAAAGASGAVGPNLDESQPDYELAVDRVTNGAGAMPAYGDQLSEEQIQDVAAYVVASTSG